MKTVNKIYRFFLDVRAGCAAVRDRLSPDYNPDYQGKSFGEFIKDEEEKFTGVRPDSSDLIKITDAHHYFKKYNQLNRLK